MHTQSQGSTMWWLEGYCYMHEALPYLAK